jgi:hypothetical protein
MENLNKKNRRHFLTKIIQACGITCLGLKNVLTENSYAKESILQEKHKFDAEYERKLTYAQFFNIQYGEFIQFAKALEHELGKEKLIEFLKKYTNEKAIKIGKNQAKHSPDNSFKTYIHTFRSESYKKLLTMEIVEDTEKAYELNVSECIWAKTFQNANAGEIGYNTVCFGDYKWAESFNSKIKLLRDKTLMQGDNCCNHRYIFTG